MQGVDSRVYLLGPYSGGDFSQGLDDPELIKQLPDGYSGGISTDALDLVMPDIKQRFGSDQSTP
jgi:glycerophosphoryl diester phosphodiesterase